MQEAKLLATSNKAQDRRTPLSFSFRQNRTEQTRTICTSRLYIQVDHVFCTPAVTFAKGERRKTSPRKPLRPFARFALFFLFSSPSYFILKLGQCVDERVSLLLAHLQLLALLPASSISFVAARREGGRKLWMLQHLFKVQREREREFLQ